jgi:hypothetical protein
MSNDFENLAESAAKVLVSAMVVGSWEIAKRNFAALLGHERQLESTHANLAAKRGRDLDQAKSEQARDWVTRLQDILDSNPGMAPALRVLIANPSAPPEPVIRSQSQHAGGGSGNVFVGGSNAGDVATGGSKIDKRKFRFSPLISLGHAAKQAVAHPAVTVITLVVGAGAVSGGIVFTHHKAEHKAAPSPAASTGPAPAHTAGPSSLSDDASWPQLGGPARTGYQPDETRIGPADVTKLAQKRTYQATAGGDSVSAPLIANGILYVDVGNRLDAFDATGATGCSDTPATCTPLWTAPTAYFFGMTVADGDVFVTDQEGVQAFDAAGTADCSGTPKVCAPLWATSTNTLTGPGFLPGSGSPVVANGVLYVPGYGDGDIPRQGGAYMAAFDAAGSADCSGTPTVCVPMWTTTGVPLSTGNPGSPAIANGVLYIGSGRTLYAFDAAGSAGCSGTPKTCAPLWTGAMSGPSSTATVVAGGIVYVGTESGLYAFDAAGTANCSTGTTAKTCAPLWIAPVNAGALAVANGVVYAAAGASLYALDAAAPANCPGTGTAKTCSRAPLWSSAAGTLADSGPWLTVANGVVYITSANGGIDAYDAAGSLNCPVSGTAKTCTPLWDNVTGFTGGGSPAIVNGVLYVNAPGNGDVYAFSP